MNQWTKLAKTHQIKRSVLHLSLFRGIFTVGGARNTIGGNTSQICDNLLRVPMMWFGLADLHRLMAGMKNTKTRSQTAKGIRGKI